MGADGRYRTLSRKGAGGDEGGGVRQIGRPGLRERGLRRHRLKRADLKRHA
jgi:hypothetical protein